MPGSGHTSAALAFLLSVPAFSADLSNPPGKSALQWAASGDESFRQARFEEAEGAYNRALTLDPKNVRANLGLGRIAEVFSDQPRAARHYSAAYQAEPLNPDAILAFAGAITDRSARRVLLDNYLLLSPAKDRAYQDACAKLRVENQLGDRSVAVLASPHQRYRLRLTGRPDEPLTLHARVGKKDVALIVDSGATGIVLNATSARNAGLEFLAPAALTGFGKFAASPAQVALADTFVTADLAMENVLVYVTEADLVPHADGVIGLDLFEHFLIQLDVQSRVLELVPFEPGPFEPGGDCRDCTRAYRLGHLLLVRASVNGSQEGYFMLDTGSSHTLIAQNMFSVEGISFALVGTQGPHEAILPAVPATLRVGERRLWGFHYATLDLNSLSGQIGTKVSGVIGSSLLSGMMIKIDYKHGLVSLEDSRRN